MSGDQDPGEGRERPAVAGARADGSGKAPSEGPTEGPSTETPQAPPPSTETPPSGGTVPSGGTASGGETASGEGAALPAGTDPPAGTRPAFLPPAENRPPAAAPAAYPPPAEPEGPGTAWNMATIITGSLLLVSAFLPWAQARLVVGLFGRTLSRDLGTVVGIEADRVVAAIPVLAVVAIGMGFWGIIGRDARVSALAAVPGLMALMVCGLFVLRLDRLKDRLAAQDLSVGYEVAVVIGWYLAVAMSLLVVGFSLGRPVAARLAAARAEKTAHPQNPYPQDPSYGQNPYGQGQYAQEQYAQEQYGQREQPAQGPHAQGQYAQNPYTQTPYGQNPYAESPYVENPYAQNPYGQDPYAQNTQDPRASWPQDAWPDRPGQAPGSAGPDGRGQS